MVKTCHVHSTFLILQISSQHHLSEAWATLLCITELISEQSKVTTCSSSCNGLDWHIIAPSNPKAHNQGSQNADYLKRELGQNKKCALCCSIQIEFLLNKTLWLQELCFPFGFLHLYKKTNKHYCFRTGLLWEAGRNNTTVLQYSGWWSWFSDC